MNSLDTHDSSADQAHSPQGLLTIGEMARHFGVSLRALRFYEDRGLIKPLRQGLTRLYDDKTRARLSMILKGKQLGFTLTEISRMLDERQEGNETEVALALAPNQVLEQIDILERQRAEIDAALIELKETQARLAAMPAQERETSAMPAAILTNSSQRISASPFARAG
jgi:DNA-binding transcriptional MerR regulator